MYHVCLRIMVGLKKELTSSTSLIIVTKKLVFFNWKHLIFRGCIVNGIFSLLSEWIRACKIW